MTGRWHVSPDPTDLHHRKISTLLKGTLMSKSSITKLFIGSGIAIIAGAVLFVAAVWLAIANDAFVMNGADIVGLRGSPIAGFTLGLGILGSIAVIGGFAGGLVSWIGALLNTWKLESKAWFVAVLLLGIFNLGFFAMIGYLIAGPDGANGSTARTHALASA